MIRPRDPEQTSIHTYNWTPNLANNQLHVTDSEPAQCRLGAFKREAQIAGRYLLRKRRGGGGAGGGRQRQLDARGGGLGDGGVSLALLVLGVGLAVDEDDAPALHHLAEGAQPLHRRANLHLPPPPARLPLLPRRFLVERVGFLAWLGFGDGSRWARQVEARGTFSYKEKRIVGRPN
jgi:hypothetical protein